MVPDPVHAGELSLGEADSVLISLEQRVHRLEHAVAALQEKSVPEAATPQIKAPPDEVASHNDKVKGGDPPPAQPAEMEHARPLPYPLPRPRPAWLLFEVYTETRAMVRMFFDRRYHVAWTTRLVAILLVAMILTSHWWFPLGWSWVPFHTYFDKLLDFILAFLVYKVLSREARRYRERIV